MPHQGRKSRRKPVTDKWRSVFALQEEARRSATRFLDLQRATDTLGEALRNSVGPGTEMMRFLAEEEERRRLADPCPKD
jgi:hypothetical protein